MRKKLKLVDCKSFIILIESLFKYSKWFFKRWSNSSPVKIRGITEGHGLDHFKSSGATCAHLRRVWSPTRLSNSRFMHCTSTIVTETTIPPRAPSMNVCCLGTKNVDGHCMYSKLVVGAMLLVLISCLLISAIIPVTSK